MATKEELEGLTVPQLKERLKEAGLTVGGKKAELVERLLSSSTKKAPSEINLGSVAAETNSDDDESSKGSSEDLPLFKSIMADGLGSADLDYRIVGHPATRRPQRTNANVCSSGRAVIII